MHKKSKLLGATLLMILCAKGAMAGGSTWTFSNSSNLPIVACQQIYGWSGGNAKTEEYRSLGYGLDMNCSVVGANQSWTYPVKGTTVGFAVVTLPPNTTLPLPANTSGINITNTYYQTPGSLCVSCSGTASWSGNSFLLNSSPLSAGTYVTTGWSFKQFVAVFQAAVGGYG